MKRYQVLTLMIAFAGYLSGHADTHATTDNVIIDDEIHTYTIIEKNGAISAVKSEKETTYTALRTDGFADAITTYNDNISIDKASAPGTKPYYRSRERSDVFYDGSRICYMHVPVKKDKKVKVTFHQTYKNPEHFCNVNLASPYHMKHGRTVIKVPSALAATIKVEPFKLPDNITLTSETLADGSMIYTAEVKDLESFKWEKGAPEASVSAPQLVVTGMFKDVGELYRHFRKFTEGTDAGSPEIDRLAAEIAAKASGAKAIADSTAAWVRHNIRYLAVEHGEYAFRPEPAPDVLNNKAGDCKGSANLIKALLKSNGLDGRLVWIGTNGDIPFDWDKVPALCSGNHVIAACVLPDTTLFLDGTTTWSGPGYIPPSIRGRQVIIEDGDNYILTNVPDTGMREDGEHLSADLRIDGNDLKGTLIMELSGVNKMSFLSSIANTEPRNREVRYKKMLTYPRKSAEASDINVEANLSKNTVRLSGNVVEKNAAKKIGDKIYVDLKPVRDALLETVDTKERTRPYALPFGYRSSYSYSVEIPEGYKVESLPDPVTLDDEWYEASLNYSEENGNIVCTAIIETRSIEADLASIPERNNGVKAIKRASDSQITLSPI